MFKIETNVYLHLSVCLLSVFLYIVYSLTVALL